MNYLKERVAYLKGLAEGMKLNDSTNEGKLIMAIIDVLDDMALAVEDIEDVQEQLSNQIDNIEEDLAEIESIIFDDEEEYDDDKVVAQIHCPYCNKEIDVYESMIDEEENTIECPECHKNIDIEWDCCCDEGSDSEQ